MSSLGLEMCRWVDLLVFLLVVRILSIKPKRVLISYHVLTVLQWQWVPVGSEGKEGRVYTFPLTFGPAPSVSMEKREEGLTSLSTWLEGAVLSGHLRQGMRKQTIAFNGHCRLISLHPPPTLPFMRN